MDKYYTMPSMHEMDTKMAEGKRRNRLVGLIVANQLPIEHAELMATDALERAVQTELMLTMLKQPVFR